VVGVGQKQASEDKSSWSKCWEGGELLKWREEAPRGARKVLLQGSFYEVSLALVGVASLA
jgi:hypothetical protein